VTLSIDQISELFAGLKKLPKAVNREPTFMEIAGYPHFENVCSNILSFYLQPSNEHGLGTLFLDVLATLIDKEIEIDRQAFDIKREVLTNNQNRIDLIIESDNYILGIENKIYADPYNPFWDYSEYLESLSGGRRVYKILLSLRSIQPSSQLCGFYPIGYEIFFQKVLEKIGSCFLTAHEPHTTFLRDFIQTMQNLQEVTTLDRQRLEYFSTNYQNITILLNEVDGLRQDMRRKVQQLKEVVAFEDISTCHIESGLWRSSKGLIDVNWYIVKLNDTLWLPLDVCLTPAGWNMQFWNKKGTREQAKQWVRERKIEIEISTGSLWRMIYSGEDNHKSYDAELEDVRTWTIDMLKRLTSPVPYKSIDTDTNLLTSSSAIDTVALFN
jgi:PD-(D/E)XK nuclease superfamily